MQQRATERSPCGAVEHCIKTYIEVLKEEYKTAVDGKNPNCKKCDPNGEVDINIMGKTMRGTCSCFENNKSNIEKKIVDLRNVYDSYFMKFGNLDDDLTLDRYAILFEREELISLIKNYLINGLPFSILFSGESASGKTTLLKIIYQILILNGIKVCYFNCADFESSSSTLHFGNFDDSREVKIMIERATNANVVLMDDHLCLANKNCLAGYYKIFDYMRAYKKTLIMSSNKNYEEIKSAYFAKDSLMSERLSTRLSGLNLIEIQTTRNISQCYQS